MAEDKQWEGLTVKLQNLTSTAAKAQRWAQTLGITWTGGIQEIPCPFLLEMCIYIQNEQNLCSHGNSHTHLFFFFYGVYDAKLGICLRSLAVKALSPNHWAAREFPHAHLLTILDNLHHESDPHGIP